MRLALPIFAGLLSACGPSLLPTTGRLVGGETVELRATGLRSGGPVTVYLDGVPVRSLVVYSDKRASFRTPPGDAEGLVELRLVFASGRTESYPAAFTYSKGALVVSPQRARP